MIYTFDSRAKNFNFHIDGKGGYKYYTFTPDPLCGDEPKYQIDEEMSMLLAKAHRLLGLLEGMSSFLTNIAAIESAFLHKEAFWSCQIDKIEVPLYDVMDTSQKATSKTLPVRNNAIAMMNALNLTSKNYSNSNLCNIHSLLMNGMRDEGQGQIRKTQTFFSTHSIEDFPNYNPSPPEKLNPLLRDLESFIKADDNIDTLIKIALAHYQFEALHPFVSGNGRLGRILVYLILADKKLLSKPLFSLSRYLGQNKVEYFDRLEAVHNFSRYDQWIKFFLTAIIYSADEAYTEIKNWLVLREKNIDKINDLGRLSKSTKKVYDVVERFPIFDINSLSREASMAYNTVDDAVKRLIEIGIVKKSNDMNRNRDFSYVGFIECFFKEARCL